MEETDVFIANMLFHHLPVQDMYQKWEMNACRNTSHVEEILTERLCEQKTTFGNYMADY